MTILSQHLLALVTCNPLSGLVKVNYMAILVVGYDPFKEIIYNPFEIIPFGEEF